MDGTVAPLTRFLKQLSRRRSLRYGVATGAFIFLGLAHHSHLLNLQWSATIPVTSLLIGAASGFFPSVTVFAGLSAWGWLGHTGLPTLERALCIVCLSGVGGWIDYMWRRNNRLIVALDDQVSKYQKLSAELQNRVDIEMRRLRKNEEHVRVLVDGVRDYAIILLDQEGCVVTWNSGAERIKGWSAQEIVGQSYELFYPPERRVAGDPQRALAHAREHGQFHDRGYRIRRDGSRFIADATLTALRDPDGAFCGYAKITRDVTEIEEARRNAEQNERSAALGRLAAGVAHDFNNVLQVIAVNAEMIKEAPADALTVRRCASRMMKAAKRGAAISGRLLEFARREDYDRDGWHIEPIFDSIRDLLGPLLPVSISIRTFAETDLPSVLGQASQFETVITNLATNARDAMPDGGMITLAARTVVLGPDNELDLQPGRFVRVSITDNGKGMDTRTLAQVTQPFFTTKPKGQGTGLGLGLAKKFAEECGGAFSITSELGQFTEVTMWLPVATYSASEDQKAEEALEKRSAVGRILVVDDDELVRDTIVMMLNRRGFTLVEVSNGEDAIAMLQNGSQAIDAILVDYGLPGMSGSAVIREARCVRPDLPALLVTGNIGEMDIAGGGTPIGVLRKPFSPLQLFEAVVALLNPVGEQV